VRGAAYNRKGDYEQAIADTSKAIAIDSKFASAYINRSNIYAQKGDFDRAIADATRAIEIDPKNANAYDNRGFAHFRKGDYDLAIADATKAIDIDPNLAHVYAYRGAAYERKGDHDRAAADDTKAIELDPKQAAGFSGRASAQASKGNYDTAIADATKAIEIDPKNPRPYSVRAAAYERKGEYDLALAEFTRLVEIDPADFRNVRELGILRFVKGDFKSASDDLLHALELKDDLYAMLFRYLARAHTGEGEAAEAELAENAGRWKVKVWPYAFIELYLGKRSPDAMLDAAVRRSDRCLVQFYVGEWHTLKGNSGKAMTALSTAVEICSKDTLEYRAATAELARLKP